MTDQQMDLPQPATQAEQARPPIRMAPPTNEMVYAVTRIMPSKGRPTHKQGTLRVSTLRLLQRMAALQKQDETLELPHTTFGNFGDPGDNTALHGLSGIRGTALLNHMQGLGYVTLLMQGRTRHLKLRLTPAGADKAVQNIRIVEGAEEVLRGLSDEEVMSELRIQLVPVIGRASSHGFFTINGKQVRYQTKLELEKLTLRDLRLIGDLHNITADRIFDRAKIIDMILDRQELALRGSVPKAEDDARAEPVAFAASDYDDIDQAGDDELLPKVAKEVDRIGLAMDDLALSQGEQAKHVREQLYVIVGMLRALLLGVGVSKTEVGDLMARLRSKAAEI